ncbi:MAG: HAD family hydrolase [Pyramidobacter sp.]
MDKKFCIFDMDGTLVDSMGWWERMEFDYLIARGAQPGPQLNALVARLKPLTLIDAAGVFISELGFRDTPQHIADEMNAVMAENYRLRVPVKPGVKEYLEALRQRGAKLCTASATDVRLVKICLERLGIAEYFDFMMSCEEVHASKDRPDVYFEAARRLGSKPADTAVFEDSLRALRTAKAAGFYAVAVYDVHSEADLPELRRICDEYIGDWNRAARKLSC